MNRPEDMDLSRIQVSQTIDWIDQRSHDALANNAYQGFPAPMVIVDDDGIIRDFNWQGEAVWDNVKSEHVNRSSFWELGFRRLRHEGAVLPEEWTVLQDLLKRNTLQMSGQLVAKNDKVHNVSLIGYHMMIDRDNFFAFVIFIHSVHDDIAPGDWVSNDPITGFPNRIYWERHLAQWNQAPGCLMMMDVDNLKTVNDLYGHPEGDRLLQNVGNAFRNITHHFVIMRFGGDEFVAWSPNADPALGLQLANEVNGQLEREALARKLPFIPHLSYGIADFGAGGLGQALKEADERMYEHKGTLLRSRRGGRLIISRSMGLVGSEGWNSWELQAYVKTAESANLLEKTFPELVDNAQKFVGFIEPGNGTAVVEVYAGKGWTTIDGGLAERVGHDGVLLVTDPSPVSIFNAQRRAYLSGLDWIRFMVAPVARLPLASHGADLVVGSWFGHSGDLGRILGEMTRVTRAGGQVAVNLLGIKELSGVWREILEPAWAALTAAQIPAPSILGRLDDVLEQYADLGISVEKTAIQYVDAAPFANVEDMGQYVLEGGILERLLHGVPESTRRAVVAQVRAKMRKVFTHSLKPEDYQFQICSRFILAVKF